MQLNKNKVWSPLQDRNIFTKTVSKIRNVEEAVFQISESGEKREEAARTGEEYRTER